MLRTKGMMMLEVMLGVILLAGLIILMMYAMNSHEKQKKAEEIGVALATAVSAVFEDDNSDMSSDTQYLVDKTGTACTLSGYLTNLTKGYVEGVGELGIDLCSATVTRESCSGGSCPTS